MTPKPPGGDIQDFMVGEPSDFCSISIRPLGTGPHPQHPLRALPALAQSLPFRLFLWGVGMGEGRGGRQGFGLGWPCCYVNFSRSFFN